MFLSRLGTVPFLESTRALKTHDGVIPGIRRFLSNFGVEDGALRFRYGGRHAYKGPNVYQDSIPHEESNWNARAHVKDFVAGMAKPPSIVY